MKSTFFLIVLFLYFVYGIEAISVLTHHHVYIYSELSRDTVPLVFHCFSGDNDFGNQTLHPGQSFHWDFKSNLFATTLYSCRFWWRPRQKRFDAFDAAWREIYNTYNYVVRDDGFYLNFNQKNHDAGLKFLYPWE